MTGASCKTCRAPPSGSTAASRDGLIAGFGEFEAWRDAQLEQEERDAQKLDRKIVAEEHWVRYGVTARRKRNVRRMAGLAELRASRREAKKSVGEVKLTVADGKMSGRLVVEAEDVGKSYGERPIVKNLSLRVLRGDRWRWSGRTAPARRR